MDLKTLQVNFPGIALMNLTTPELVTIPTLQVPAYSSQWFEANADVIQFDALSRGPTIKHTENSIYPRSEFRETLVDGTLAAWTTASQPYHSMTWDIDVIRDGIDHKVIIGQIHGKGTHPPLKIQWENGDVTVEFRPSYNSAEVKHTIESGLPSATGLHFSVEVQDDTIFVHLSVNNNSPITVSQLMDVASYFTTNHDGWYFKQGNYMQSEVETTKPDGTAWSIADIEASRGTVMLYALSIYHGVHPVSVQPPVDPQVALVQDLTTQLDAVMIGYTAAGSDVKARAQAYVVAHQAVVAISAKIKTVTDADKRLALNNLAASVATQLATANKK